MSAVSQSHIAHVPFSRTKRAYSVTSRPFNTCGHDATSDPSGWLVILAVLNSGCGDGAGEAAQEDDVDMTPQLNWLAMSTSRVGPVGDVEQAHATTRAHTDINTRTMTSHHTGARVLTGTLQMSCQRQMRVIGAKSTVCGARWKGPGQFFSTGHPCDAGSTSRARAFNARAIAPMVTALALPITIVEKRPE